MESYLSIMTPLETIDHLKLCRELYNQLRRLQAHQDHNYSAVSTSLPINLTGFLRSFGLYIKWVERNSKVVDIAVRRPPVRIGQNSEPA